MGLPDFEKLLDSKTILATFSALAGALFGNFVAVYRNRIKVLEYTVTHDRVGLSANDAIFGTIRVTWQGSDVTNLYTTVVTIQNTTSSDYTSLRVKVYTGNTLLLTERTEIAGTTYSLRFTEDYLRSINVPSSATPTEDQFHLVRHQREYVIPVLNRGQRVILHYLTSVPTSNEGPSVWVDLLHPSAQIVFRPLVQQIHGVPVRLALPLGLFVCLAIFVAISTFISEPWAAAAIAMVAGLMAQTIGAGFYRAYRFFKHIVLR